MTEEREKAEANRELQKLTATLKTAMLAKATMEFAMRTSRSKPKEAEKFEKLKEEEAKALVAVEEFQTYEVARR